MERDKAPKRTINDVLMSASRSRPRKRSPTKNPKSHNHTSQSPAPTTETTIPPSITEESIIQLNNKSAVFWKEGDPVPFLFLSRALDSIANEDSRTAKTEILCNVFRTVVATTPKDLTAVVCLSCNKIAPSYKGVELGIGEPSIVKAMAEAYMVSEKHIKDKLKKLGDLGLVAKASCSSQAKLFNYKPAPLTVVKVLNTFRAIAEESGKDSQGKKRYHIEGLLKVAIDCEPQYLIRYFSQSCELAWQSKPFW